MEYAAEPPPGVIPDYEHPARNGVRRLFVVIPLLMAIATVMVGLRLYARKFIVKKMGLDDCKDFQLNRESKANSGYRCHCTWIGTFIVKMQDSLSSKALTLIP